MDAIPLYRHSTAGYLLDFARGAAPGRLAPGERAVLRALAEQVREIALAPEQECKRQEWYRHNALGKGRPLLLLFPENAWEEILPESVLQLTDPFWRNQEWYLRHLLYRAEHFPDDFVIEPELVVTLQIRRGGWGLQGIIHRPELDKGAYKVDPPISNPEDIHRLRCPDFIVDRETSEHERAVLLAELGDLLDIRIDCLTPHANLIGEAAGLRGIDQLMLDMYDRPEWVHQLMGFITAARLDELRQLAEGGYLTLNNRGQYNDAGGIGYSRELPAPDWQGGKVRPCDLWGYGVAQELVSVGPAQHQEFVLDYQNQLLTQFGLNAYGCCEPYDQKYDILETIPRLRRVSVSPWASTQVAARRLVDRCIISWKPNPAMLVGCFDQEAVRSYIRAALRDTRDCVVEVVLKDTYTVEFVPQRLDVWARIAREEIDRLG